MVDTPLAERGLCQFYGTVLIRFTLALKFAKMILLDLFQEYLCIDKLFPEYNIGKLFVCYEFLRALQLDGLDSSHPIEVPVGHPAEIDEIFDAISYAKGASVIRMLYHYIGDEVNKG